LSIEKSFQLFVITQPDNFKDEESFISQLLESGVSGIYLRKTNYSSAYISDILKSVDTKFHHKLIIPFSFYDENSFQNIKSIIHFKEKERTKDNFFKVPTDTILSTSIHDLNEWELLAHRFKIVFYSPVFESISKPNYKPKISLEELTTNHKPQTTNFKQLIALGGINEQNILQVKDAGFNGAALLGSIWKSDKPIENFKKIKMIIA
jgi:thiamine-phosphate pyrophosphorylase